MLLALEHGLAVTAHHVDHGLHPASSHVAERVRTIAAGLGVRCTVHRVDVGGGPNLEARARGARLDVLPAGVMTGHTLDDQAETLLLRLVRGSATTGLAAMTPGVTKPILGLRRSETEAVCTAAGIEPVRDPMNDDPTLWRNRVRHELLPLLDDIAGRDVAPIIARTADLLRDDDRLLDALADGLDPTDARAIAAADPVVARRALRRWLTDDGYPPDAAAIERVLAVARGEVRACQLPGGRRVQRTGQRLAIVRSGG